MDITAKTKYVRLSPDRARGLARKLVGLPVGDALKMVDFSPRKAGGVLGKTLKSAIANAENNAKLSVDELVVKSAIIDEGPRQRRYWPRARGGVSPILRRTCHITVVLTDGSSDETEGLDEAAEE